MSHCVFWAYRRHMECFDAPIRSSDWHLYTWLKQLAMGTHHNPTPGWMVPWLIELLANTHDLDTVVQYRLVTRYHRLADVHTNAQRQIVMWGHRNGEVAKLTLEPAIYLLLADDHAVFSETVPNYGLPVMAIQLRERTWNDSR